MHMLACLTRAITCICDSGLDVPARPLSLVLRLLNFLLQVFVLTCSSCDCLCLQKPRLLIPNTKKPTASTGNPKKNKSKGAKAPEPPPDPTHDGLFSALMTLTRHCCRVDYTKQTDKELRAPMRACTPYTLAFLLASAISRMDVRIHGDTPARSEKEALIALRDACMLIIPPPLMLSFKSITEMLLLSLDEAEAEAAGVESAAMKALRKAAQKTHVSSRSELAAAMSLLVSACSTWLHALQGHHCKDPCLPCRCLHVETTGCD